jgi:hypothetical protein
MEFLIVNIPGTHLYDLFENHGWNNWTRVLIKYDQIRVLKGMFIPDKVLREIATQAGLLPTTVKVLEV